MKKKQVFELFFYAILTAVGIILFFNYQPKKREYGIIPDFSYETQQIQQKSKTEE